MNRLLRKFDSSSKNTDKKGSRSRGELGEDVTELAKINAFSELPKEGQEAFFRFLCNDKYPEDKDVCDVNPNAEDMNTRFRRYQCWLKCEKVELLNLFDTYLSMDDDLRLPEVGGLKEAGEELTDFLNRKKMDAENTQTFIEDLKSKLKHELDSDFTQFKDHLRKYKK